MGCFFALQRAVAPCLNGYLFPTALFASRLNCRSRGGVEICLVSKRMFIPDGTPVLVTEYYILTRRKPEVLNMVACSATSVEFCLCRRVLRAWQKVRLRRWGRSKHADLTAIKEFFNWYPFCKEDICVEVEPFWRGFSRWLPTFPARRSKHF